jgi:hypothetical protein
MCRTIQGKKLSAIRSPAMMNCSTANALHSALGEKHDSKTLQGATRQKRLADHSCCGDLFPCSGEARSGLRDRRSVRPGLMAPARCFGSAGLPSLRQSFFRFVSGATRMRLRALLERQGSMR